MKISLKFCALLSPFVFFTGASTAQAMDLDWSGQFRSEAVLINNYAPDTTVTGTDGYPLNGAGATDARFQSLFLRLRPKLIVNDNVVIKTEWWLGNPVTGFYGSDYPGTSRTDERYYNSTFSAGSAISAQRYWAEFLTDLGTFQVGRAPQHWGLGLIHNSGDGLFDRYQSTGDTYTMIAKFGNFTLIPGHTKYYTGAAVGGTCVGATCTHPIGGQTLSEYTVGLKYENRDEDFEGGVKLIRRVAGAQSESTWINNNNGAATAGMNLTVWDIYAKKRMGKVDFAIETPIFNGDLVGYSYKAFAVATELRYRPNDTWNFSVKAGKAPGQANSNSVLAGQALPEKWQMVYFHPNYRLGMLLFNYNFSNFGGPNVPNTAATGSVKSIYDAPITNANYLMVGTTLSADKWQFNAAVITAKANETATTGSYFFNSLTRTYSTSVANHNQGNSLGTEVDLGAALNWDEFTTFALDFGLLFQGDYFKFVNGPADNDLKTVFGAVGSIGVKF